MIKIANKQTYRQKKQFFYIFNMIAIFFKKITYYPKNNYKLQQKNYKYFQYNCLQFLVSFLTCMIIVFAIA